MKCKACGHTPPDGSIYCNMCGTRLIKERKQRGSVKVPAPILTASGKWRIQLRREGVSITEDTAEKATAKAIALRAGWVSAEAKAAGTLGEIVDTYIEEHSAVLSPSTVRTYKLARASAFKSAMTKYPSAINWQAVVNAEARTVHPKTLRNNWGLVAASLRYAKYPVPDITLPQVPKADKAFLDKQQIETLLAAVRGEPCELTVLLALHSLRRSELLALDKRDIHDGNIYVHGAAVWGEAGLTYKDTNKNSTSARTVPVMIPRLEELVADAPEGRLITAHANTAYKQINRICEANGLPLVGVHGLRHSFLTLAFSLRWNESTAMAVGGWADMATVNAVYRHLSVLDKNEDIGNMAAFYSRIYSQNEKTP